MEIKVAYIATLEEYYDADENFRTQLNKSSVDLYVLIILGIIALAFMLIGQYFLGGVIAVAAFIIQQGYVKRWIVRRNFGKIVHAGEQESLTFSEDHIVYECGVVLENIDWDEYAAFLETEQLFLLFYHASDHYAIVPKRAMTNDAEIEQLRRLLIRKLANYEVDDV